VQAKQLLRISHFNPAGIALTSFFTVLPYIKQIFIHYGTKLTVSNEIVQTQHQQLYGDVIIKNNQTTQPNMENSTVPNNQLIRN
jgi:predicted membrane-bound spermidine synthase